MPYNIRPETFSIIHIFISRLSFPMPLAISHFFYSHISACDIWELKQGRFLSNARQPVVYFLPFLAMVLSTFFSNLSL